MRRIDDISYANHDSLLPLLGGFIENLFPYWWDDYSSVADYLDFYLDGFSPEEIAAMAHEYRLLEIDHVRDAEVNAFLRRMNANYSNDRGPSGGREMLAEIGERLGQLERGAIPKHFN